MPRLVIPEVEEGMKRMERQRLRETAILELCWIKSEGRELVSCHYWRGI